MLISIISFMENTVTYKSKASKSSGYRTITACGTVYPMLKTTRRAGEVSNRRTDIIWKVFCGDEVIARGMSIKVAEERFSKWMDSCRAITRETT